MYRIKLVLVNYAEHYAPYFVNWCFFCCSNFAYWCVNVAKTPNIAVPFYRKSLKNSLNFNNTDILYRLMLDYARTLVETNCSRKAYKFMKQYIH